MKPPAFAVGRYRNLRPLLAWLINHLTHPPRAMIELGSHAGHSAFAFSRIFKQVHCVDLWQDYDDDGAPEMAKHGTQVWSQIELWFDDIARGNPRIHKHKTDIFTLSKQWTVHVDYVPLDFIYIDGNHNYESVRADLSAWLPHAHRYIGGHDFSTHFPGVEQAVAELLGPASDARLKLFPDSSWIWDLMGSK